MEEQEVAPLTSKALLATLCVETIIPSASDDIKRGAFTRAQPSIPVHQRKADDLSGVMHQLLAQLTSTYNFQISSRVEYLSFFRAASPRCFLHKRLCNPPSTQLLLFMLSDLISVTSVVAVACAVWIPPGGPCCCSPCLRLHRCEGGSRVT